MLRSVYIDTRIRMFACFYNFLIAIAALTGIKEKTACSNYRERAATICCGMGKGMGKGFRKELQ